MMNPRPAKSTDPPSEALTRREREVLALLVGDLTNAEMAAKLTLAPSSVKWYIQQIYSKLGVDNRREAVRRAREVGLLGTGKVESRPTGTVTFLFSDIEGSTQLWEQHPQAMKDAFSRHEKIIRETMAKHGGYVYKMVGDAFQVAFSAAPQALLAALASQKALQSEAWGKIGDLKVRMAIHTGMTEERGDDYVGPALNRLARLVSAGHGGQILVTQATFELIRDNLPEGADVRDLGEHRLKDLVEPEHIYQLTVPGLYQDFPPIRTFESSKNNLPIELTSFIGREKELSELKRLMASGNIRLLTLTGPGGTGKTRLSLRLAADLLDSFPDGVWLVELAPLSDPSLVPQSLASCLGVRETSTRPTLFALVEYLRAKHMLLILDNCEHVVEACASLAARLLTTCPGVFILSSSREALDTPGETIFRVPSLSTPNARRLPSLETLSQYEAVRLFIDRGSTVLPGFSISPGNAKAIAQICNRLDGIPLAIELAAARLRVLAVEDIASRLDDSFRLLRAGSRTAIPRHQTLRALIDWSYNLLSAPEQILLQKLSAFAGGWTVEAAEAVCAERESNIQNHVGGFYRLDSKDTLDLLTQLVDKSLVQADIEPGAERRYHLLEVIRQYAGEKAKESGTYEDIRSQHMEYYLQLVERIEPQLRGTDMPACLDRVEIELDNLRSAFEWAMLNQAEKSLRLASSMLWFWIIRGDPSEGIAWLDRSRSKVREWQGNEGKLLWARGLAANSFLRNLQRDLENARLLSEESLELFRQSGHEGRQGAAFSLFNLSNNAYLRNDKNRARSLLEESLAIYRAEKDQIGSADCLVLLSNILMDENNYEQALDVLKEAQDLRQEQGDIDGLGYVFTRLGRLSLLQGEHQKAQQYFSEGLDYYEKVRNKQAISQTVVNLGLGAWAQGNYAQVYELNNQALTLSRDMRNKATLVATLHSIGIVADSMGDYDRASNHFEEALVIAREIELKPYIAYILFHLGRIAWAQGNDAQAKQIYDEMLSIGQECHLSYVTASALVYQGILALQQGNPVLAKSLAREALSYEPAILDAWIEEYSLYLLADLALEARQAERAARLCGAAQQFEASIRLSQIPDERAAHARILEKIRAALSEEAFQAAWNEGQAMKLEQAVHYALGNADD